MSDRPLRNLSLAVLLVGAASAAVSVMAANPQPGGLPSSAIVALNLIYWGAWAAMVPMAASVAAGIRSNVAPRVPAVLAHVAAACGCALLHISLISVARILLLGVTQGRPVTLARIWFHMAGTERLAIEWELTMYGAIAVFAYASALQAEARQRDVAFAQLQAGLSEARLLSLQRQLQPHFLFNTLHAIAALIRRDPSTAETMIDRLSQLLRTTFRSAAAAEVRLDEDLATLEDYLAIELTQMRERLTVSFDIAPDVLDAAVPVLLTQPLVENAVRHGLHPRAAGGRVSITAVRAGGDLCIEIVDDGIGIRGSGQVSSGVGLSNTRSRLEQLYGDRHTFTIGEVPGGGVRVSMRIPYRQLPATRSPFDIAQRRAS